MIMCPNFKNPDVAREFNELKEATSEQAAYRIWSLNNGNAIDKAPNGAESKLFHDLLDWFSGHGFEDSYARKLAIQAKAKTYSLSFLNWFGDWVNDSSSASKVVDENGEPLVVYHGGSKRIRTSKHFIVPHEQEDVVYDVDENGDPIYGPGQEYNLGTFFTTDKQYALIYLYGRNEKLLYPCFLNIKNPGYDDNMSSKHVALTVEDNKWVESDGFQPLDGLIGHDAKTLSGILSNGEEFAVFEANLIKSIYNDGAFSDSDNIYHRNIRMLQYITKKTFEKYADLAQFLESRLVYYFGLRTGRKMFNYLLTEQNAAKSLYDSKPFDGLYDLIDFYIDNVFEKDIDQEIHSLDLLSPFKFLYEKDVLIKITKALKEKKINGNIDEDYKLFGNWGKELLLRFFPALYRSGANIGKLRGFYLKLISEGKIKIGKFVKDYNKYNVFAKIATLLKLKNIKDDLLNKKLYKDKLKRIIAQDILNYSKLHNSPQKKDILDDSTISFDRAVREMNLFKNAIVGEINGNQAYSIRQIIFNISKNYPEYSELCNKILEKVDGDFSLIFKESDDPTNIGSHYDHEHDGHIYHYISINSNNLSIFWEKPAEYLMHEIIHSVTVQYIRRRPDLNEALHKYIEHIKKWGWSGENLAQLAVRFELTSQYGFREDKYGKYGIEFIAEFFANSEFRESLKQIPAIDEKKFDNIFKLIFHFIVSLFTNGDQSVYDQISPLMENILDLGINESEFLDLLPHVKFDNLTAIDADNVSMLSSKKPYVSPTAETKSFVPQNDILDSSSEESVDDEIAWEDAIDSEIESSELIKQFLHEECEVWVNEKMEEWRNGMPFIPTADEEELARLDYTKTFYRNKVRESLHEVQDKLLDALSITKNSTGRMREDFLVQLSEAMNDHKKARLLLQIAYNEMLGVEVQHNVRPVIHAYIETFLQSDVIQEAIKVLDNGRGLSTPKLIRDLCDVIEGKIVVGHKKKAWNEFWDKVMYKFNRLMHKVFRKGKDELTYKERRRILNNITEWFLSNEELRIEENAQCVYDMSKWTVNGKELQTQEKDVVDAIKRGVDSRLKGIRSTTSTTTSETEIDFLESWKEALLAIEGRVDQAITSLIDRGVLNPDDTSAVAEARRLIRKELQQDEISRFLINGLDELRRLSVELQNMRSNDIQFANFAKLMRMKADIMGFYEIVSSRYVQSYTRFTDNPEFKEGGSIYGQIKAIRNAVNSIKTVYDAQLERYADYIVDRIAEDYIDIGDKKLWANNAKLWLRNKIDGGNLAFLERIAGPAYTSTSPIVRILDLYVREANTAVRQDVQKRGKKLISLYDKCEPTLRKLYPGNFMRYFCELDEDGKPTGYFVSKYKIGTFEKKREKVRQLLLKKYKAEIDPDTNTPTFETEENRIAFLDEYDRARYDLGEVRRYKPEYYIAKRHILSRDTDALLSQYDNQIQRLKKGGIEVIEVDGKKVEVFMPTKLTPSARYDLERLQRERDALGNPYEIVYDSDGNIISIKEKQGVAAERARQIMEWNKWKAENIDYKPNTVKLAAVRQQLVDKYSEDSMEVKQFDWDYITRRPTQDWYDTLASFAGYTNDLYEELRDKRKALLKAIERKSGLYINRYNFDKLNGESLAILRELEHEMSLAKEKTDRDPEELKAMMQFFNYRTKRLQFAKDGTNIPFLEYERSRIESLFPGDAAKMQELYFNKYFYEDEDGNLTPLSIFLQLAPSLAADIDENVPVGIFNDVDESSAFVDDRYDPNEDTDFQIDKSRKEFMNERYDEIMKNPSMKAFYEELLNIMDEAWNNLPNIYRTSRYQMPQRRDRSSHLITRLGSFKAIMSNLFKVNENDVLFNEEVTTHADGTTVETIPVRWVKKLEDQTMVSTDILGSVIDFYEMSLNFREKQAIAAMGEALKLQTSKTSIGEIETDQASRLGTYLSMFVYGRMVKGFDGTAMSNTEKVIAKTLYRLRNLAHAKLMKHNWFAVGKNLIDSTASLLGEIYGGKHFTISMFVRAMGHMAKEILNGSAFSLGKTNTRSWTAKAMLFNGVSGSTYEMFHHRNESRARRILQMTPMIEYTFVDYSFKGMITNMVYDSYRLITNPATGKKEFMNMEQAQYAYSKAGKGRNVGFEMFEKSNITLRDAYITEIKDEKGKVIDNTVFELKDEYLDIVRPYNADLGRRSRKLEQRVSSTIRERGAIINGMLEDIDRGKLNQSYVGALVMLMRGWMISQMADNIKYGHDFARYSSDAKEFIDKSSMKKYLERVPLYGRTQSKEGADLRNPQMAEEDEDYTGMFNLVTGTIDNGVWRNLLRAYSHWVRDMRIMKINKWFGKAIGNLNITRQEVYQVRKMNAAITAVGIIATLSFVLGKSLEGDGDDPSWWKLVLYSICTGSVSELTTKLWYGGFAPTVQDLLTSFAIAPSTIFDDLDAPANVGSDFISLSIAAFKKFDNESTKDLLAPVKTGSYSKLPIGIRGNKQIEEAIGAKDGHTPQYLKNLLEASSMLPYVSDLGLANIWKNLSVSGMDTKTQHYVSRQFPTKYVIYNAQRSSQPKEQKGLFGALEGLGVIPKQEKRINPASSSGRSTRTQNRNTRRNTR